MKDFELNDFGLGTTKGQLAEKLGVSIRSIHYYHGFAMDNCDEFSDDYPRMGRDTLTSVPLTQYQCWVLWMVGKFIHTHKIPKKLLSHQLFQSEWQAKISHKAFEEFCKSQGARLNELTGICRVA
jgi:hypothetical protein